MFAAIKMSLSNKCFSVDSFGNKNHQLFQQKIQVPQQNKKHVFAAFEKAGKNIIQKREHTNLQNAHKTLQHLACATSWH